MLRCGFREQNFRFLNNGITMGTLFSSLKVERLHDKQFKNHRKAKDATLD
jgi:hypothetical protein